MASDTGDALRKARQLLIIEINELGTRRSIAGAAMLADAIEQHTFAAISHAFATHLATKEPASDHANQTTQAPPSSDLSSSLG